MGKRKKPKKNVSPQQVAANQQNAQLSTGPTSTEGKEVSSLNAMTHGAYARKVLLKWEDPHEFAAFYQELWDFFEPENQLEVQYIDDYIWERWRLRRLDVLEAQLYNSLEADDARELLHQLEKYSRLRVRCERSRDRAFKLFEQLRDQMLQARQMQQQSQVAVVQGRPLTNQGIETMLFASKPDYNQKAHGQGNTAPAQTDQMGSFRAPPVAPPQNPF